MATNQHVGRATFSLTCDPPGGDVPRPADACASLARDPRTLLRPKPFVCFGGFSSWWTLRITGRYYGTPVDVLANTCWTPQMKLIRVLGIAAVLERHVDPLSRPVFFGRLPRSELATRVEIPPATPNWLLQLTHRKARELGNARPDRLEVEAFPASFRITLEGRFRCARCRYGLSSEVWIFVGRASRRIDSLVMLR